MIGDIKWSLDVYEGGPAFNWQKRWRILAGKDVVLDNIGNRTLAAYVVNLHNVRIENNEEWEAMMERHRTNRATQ